MLLSSLGTSIANVGLPTFVRVFHASFQSVQWIVLAYLLGVTTLVVSAGRLGDLFGRRKLMLAGILVFSAASFFCSMAPSLAFLVAARVGQGMGAAMMMALTMALVGETVPAHRAGRAMGLLGTTSAIGTALGPSLGGMLIGAFGWPSIFLINVPLGLLAGALAWRYLPRDKAATHRASFDLPGSILLAGALASYALGMTLGRGHFGRLNLLLVGIAIVLSVAFLIVEAKLRSPLLRPAMFREPLVSIGFITSSLATTVAMTTLVVGPFYLSDALHLDATRIGLVMSTGPLVAALAGLPAGRAVDRFGAMRTSIAGLALMVLGTLLLSRIATTSGAAGYIAALVTLTAGFATFQAANNTAVVTGTAPAHRGVISGLLNLSRNLGLVTGASLMGAVFMAGANASAIEVGSVSGVVAGTHAAFLLAAGLIGVAIALINLPRLRAIAGIPSRTP
jgi:EmrB/QacA subfamily drug resistance transporter